MAGPISQTWTSTLAKLPALSKTVWRKSGWGYRSRSAYRGYVTVLYGPDRPVTTYLTLKAALAFIRRQESNPLELPCPMMPPQI